jgi:hypothetical protein
MSLRIIVKKKYQGARNNLRDVFDLNILFMMQLVSRIKKKDSVKEKKKKEKNHSRENELCAYDKLTAWPFFCLCNFCAY